jgi:predicted O-methyltransferase YrrM
LIAAEPPVQPVGPPTLDGFVGFYRTDGTEDVLARVREAYDRVHPLDLSDDDLASFVSVLYLAVRYWEPRVVVQTGTFVGTSSVALALGMSDNGHGTLYTIDPEPGSYFGIREPVAIARAVVGAAGLASHVRFVHGYATLPLDRGRMSLPVAPTWCLLNLPCGRYDMLVVDGDHTFRGCYLDLVHGTARLAQDGSRLVIAHDYLGIPEVRAAVSSWADEVLPAERKVVPSRCGIALMCLSEQASRPTQSIDRRS